MILYIRTNNGNTISKQRRLVTYLVSLWGSVENFYPFQPDESAHSSNYGIPKHLSWLYQAFTPLLLPSTLLGFDFITVTIEKLVPSFEEAVVQGIGHQVNYAAV